MRILLVDDDKKFLNVLVTTFEMEGIVVQAASNGLAAQRLLEREAFEPQVLIVRRTRIIENLELKSQVETGKTVASDVDDWIGESAPMAAIKTLIQQVAPTPSTPSP